MGGAIVYRVMESGEVLLLECSRFSRGSVFEKKDYLLPFIYVSVKLVLPLKEPGVNINNCTRLNIKRDNKLKKLKDKLFSLDGVSLHR
jgi:hypothetical protein